MPTSDMVWFVGYVLPVFIVAGRAVEVYGLREALRLLCRGDEVDLFASWAMWLCPLINFLVAMVCVFDWIYKLGTSDS